MTGISIEPLIYLAIFVAVMALVEGLYLTGTGYFQLKQYGAAFPILRRITNDWPNTLWANQAYYYVGMCHFAQGNWNKAIEALSLVGTFVDPNSPTVSYVEAGRRFYAKIEDGDYGECISCGEQIGVARLKARPVAELICRRATFSFASERPTKRRAAPRPASLSAATRPSPEVAPVMTTT